MNLYELTTDFKRLMEAEEEDEIANALVDITAGQIEDKVEAYCYFLANIEEEINGYKAQEKRIADARKVMENKAKRAKDGMKQSLWNADIQKIQAGTFKVSVSQTAGTTEIEDMEIIPPKYKTAVTTYIADKAAIKDAINNGETIPGAYIQKNLSLRIK